MNLQEIINHLNLNVLTTPKNFAGVRVSTGYASDLLSCVMAGAQSEGVWVTLQAHMNIVAVAALLESSAIIITEGAQPNPEVIEKANEQEVTLLSTSMPTFEVVGKLWEMGLRQG
jgi:hypothetical protein